MKLEEHISKQLDRARLVFIEGILIEPPGERSIIIVPCHCVQDSPENPCPCKDWVKVVISLEDVIGEPQKSGRRSMGGEVLWRVPVRLNSRVIVERSTTVSAEEILTETTQAAKAGPKDPDRCSSAKGAGIMTGMGAGAVGGASIGGRIGAAGGPKGAAVGALIGATIGAVLGAFAGNEAGKASEACAKGESQS